MSWIKYLKEKSQGWTQRYWTEQLKFKMKLPSTKMRKVADRKKFRDFPGDPQAMLAPTCQGSPLLLLLCKEKNSLDWLLYSLLTLQMFIVHLVWPASEKDHMKSALKSSQLMTKTSQGNSGAFMLSQGQLSCQLCNQTQWVITGLPSCPANKQRPQGNITVHGLSSSTSYTLLHTQVNRDPTHTHISPWWSTCPP